jgi:hypothetical protein
LALEKQSEVQFSRLLRPAAGRAARCVLTLGWFKDFDVLESEWVKVSGVTELDPETRKQYDHAYRIYAELHTTLKPIFMKSALE